MREGSGRWWEEKLNRSSIAVMTGRNAPELAPGDRTFVGVGSRFRKVFSRRIQPAVMPLPSPTSNGAFGTSWKHVPPTQGMPVFPPLTKPFRVAPASLARGLNGWLRCPPGRAA
jgi:hypothetical protein